MFEFDKNQKQKLEIFAALLQQENQKFNLTRITSTEQIWIKHFQDSLACVDMFKQKIDQQGEITIADIGSGAGFPGLVIAIVLDKCQVVSIESVGKKCDFQEKVASELGLKNVKVINGRAEEFARDLNFRERFDFAVSRAVAELDVLAEISFGLLKVGGIFLTWKGPKVEQELPAGQSMINKLGGGKVEQIFYNIGDDSSNYRIIKAVKNEKISKKYPRSFKEISARKKKSKD